MGLRDWFASPEERALRRQRALTELEAAQLRNENQRTRQKKSEFTLRLIEEGVRHSRETGTPDGMAMAVELATGHPVRRAGRATPASGQDQLGGALLPLFIELLKSKMDSDPIAVWERMQTLEDRAIEREQKRAKRDGSPEGVNPMLHALLHSPMGERLGETAAPLLVGLAQGMATRGGGQIQAPPPQQAQQASVQPMPPPPPGQAIPQQSALSVGVPPSGAPTPDAVLALLETAEPPQIAAQLAAWAAQGDSETERTVRALLEQTDAQIVAQLEPAARDGLNLHPWSKVARWLLAHAEQRQAIVAELHALVTAAAEQPVPLPAPVAAVNGRANGAVQAAQIGY